ncbi:hypothetical protein DC366_10290 [Pelagivirga sediminicola]|uniref:YjiS-like domain-containing protein n=1 Tax=Pelagivirga sediminicola TaxID=2170575 RepID=A0A2T7G6I6_9RHOB|nr:DUF1127 domain-containing protein [Pelagivirga sediminicola]PVA10039.1 hypothetical protein DC366_10290 [Pelagivirga sediminicola]
MSYASHAQTGRATPIQTLMSALGDVKARLAQRRSYRKTVNALSQLSDHELADLGLSRHSVHSDAWQAVYGTRQRG